MNRASTLRVFNMGFLTALMESPRHRKVEWDPLVIIYNKWQFPLLVNLGRYKITLHSHKACSLSSSHLIIGLMIVLKDEQIEMNILGRNINRNNSMRLH